MTNNPILAVDFKTEYNNVSDAITTSRRACVDMDAIQNGLIKKIGANRLPLMLVILSYMDKDGKAFPSQRKLAELSGQSVNTVNKLINELLEIEIDGQKLLRRELVGSGTRKKSMYFIHQGEVTTTDAIEAVEELRSKEEIESVTHTMGSKEVALLFCDFYKETYGEGYVVSWGKELSMIKKKLLPNFDDVALRGLVEIAVKDYKKEWASEKYPYPTITMLCTWLGNKAFGLWKQSQEKVEKFEERKVIAVQQDDSDRFLDLLQGDK